MKSIIKLAALAVMTIISLSNLSANNSSNGQPNAFFDWNMSERDPAIFYSAATHSYRPDYINPDAWIVQFHADRSVGSNGVQARHSNTSIVSYTWKITGIDVPFNKLFTVNTANFNQRFFEFGRYEVELTVKDRNGQQATYTEIIKVKDILIVLIGDSNASGEGNPIENGQQPTHSQINCSYSITAYLANNKGKEFDAHGAKWLEPFAHRSLKSGLARAALALGRKDPHTSVTFLTFATSGAKINEGLLDRQGSWQSTGQIEEVRRTVKGRQIDLLMMSIGVNDLEFAEVLGDMTGNDKSHDQVVREIEDRLRLMPSKLIALDKAIQSKLKPRKILITEYPTRLFDNADGSIGRGCDLFDPPAMTGLSHGDAIKIVEKGKELNLTLKSMGGGFGWTYVGGIDRAFKGHGYCTSRGTRYFVKAEESCKNQGDLKGTAHPNSLGHLAIRNQVLKVLLNMGLLNDISISVSDSHDAKVHNRTTAANTVTLRKGFEFKPEGKGTFTARIRN